MVNAAKSAFPWAIATLLLSLSTSAKAGQMLMMPLEELVEQSSIVGVIDVTKVSTVDASTGEHRISRIYVAEASIGKLVKPASDHPREQIVIVGSTIPRSSAVWQPIRKKKYLAFLQPEQGHFRYSYRIAFREIEENGDVEWFEKNAKGHYEFGKLPIDEALKRIEKIVKANTAKQ